MSYTSIVATELAAGPSAGDLPDERLPIVLHAIQIASDCRTPPKRQNQTACRGVASARAVADSTRAAAGAVRLTRATGVGLGEAMPVVCGPMRGAWYIAVRNLGYWVRSKLLGASHAVPFEAVRRPRAGQAGRILQLQTSSWVELRRDRDRDALLLLPNGR